MKKVIAIVLVVLLLGAVGGGGFLLYKYIKNKTDVPAKAVVESKDQVYFDGTKLVIKDVKALMDFYSDKTPFVNEKHNWKGEEALSFIGFYHAFHGPEGNDGIILKDGYNNVYDYVKIPVETLEGYVVYNGSGSLSDEVKAGNIDLIKSYMEENKISGKIVASNRTMNEVYVYFENPNYTFDNEAGTITLDLATALRNDVVKTDFPFGFLLCGNSFVRINGVEYFFFANLFNWNGSLLK